MLLALLSIAASLLPLSTQLELFAKNLSRPYTVKKTWVQNFIKFNYVLEDTSNRPRIIPVGCIPSNHIDGRLLPIGETIRMHDFVFSCQQDQHGVVSYEATGCIDGHGNEMNVGETVSLSNGTVLMHCAIQGGVVKKVTEKAAGCIYNGTIYGEDETWVEGLEEAEVKREKERKDEGTGELRGRLMQCFRPHYNFFETHVIGCVVNKFGIRIDEYAQVEKGIYVKCEETDGHISIRHLHVSELACKFGNATVAEGAVWIDDERAAEFACSGGNVMKKACMLDKQRVPLGKEVRVQNECVFVCHPGANVYMCDKALPQTVVVDEDKTPERVYGGWKGESEDSRRSIRIL